MVAPDEHQTLQALQRHRPDLVDGYRAALPAARTAILGRLWGALLREPIDGLDRRRLGGPVTGPFDPPPAEVTVDGRRHAHPTGLLRALDLPGAADRLAVELDNSVANLALALADRRAPTDTSLPDASLPDIEQSIVDGHPLHPCCRTRIGMSTLDVLAYAPEHRPRVDLHVVAVDPDRWRTTGAPVAPRLPVHPWQLPRALATGLVRDTGETIAARPLMSLRTLAPLGTPDRHLKTAVEVQMTSAVRTLSAQAVHNGPPASGLAAALARRTQGLVVLRELSAGTVLDDDGEPRRALAAVWREAPPPTATVLPLAALPHRPHLLTPAFLDSLVALALPPLLTLLHLGVALEAHGQNTLVEVRDGRAARLYYRDLGGVHVSPRRLAAAGIEAPQLLGSVPTDEPDTLRTKLFAALLSTVFASLAAAADRPALWDRVATVAREVYAQLPAGDDEAALFGDTLPLKATTAMRLASDPLEDRWARLPNPLR